MEVCRAKGTLVLSLWKSSFFWNVCARDGVHWNSFVIDWVYLFGTRSLDFGAVALRVDFRRPRSSSRPAGFCTLPCGKCSFCTFDAALV